MYPPPAGHPSIGISNQQHVFQAQLLVTLATDPSIAAPPPSSTNSEVPYLLWPIRSPVTHVPYFDQIMYKAVNLEAAPSREVNGMDLPLNDHPTLRFFFNLGVNQAKSLVAAREYRKQGGLTATPVVHGAPATQVQMTAANPESQLATQLAGLNMAQLLGTLATDPSIAAPPTSSTNSKVPCLLWPIRDPVTFVPYFDQIMYKDVNLMAAPSREVNGMDLPLNDHPTLRFFFNMGVNQAKLLLAAREYREHGGLTATPLVHGALATQVQMTAANPESQLATQLAELNVLPFSYRNGAVDSGLEQQLNLLQGLLPTGFSETQSAHSLQHHHHQQQQQAQPQQPQQQQAQQQQVQQQQQAHQQPLIQANLLAANNISQSDFSYRPIDPIFQQTRQQLVNVREYGEPGENESSRKRKINDSAVEEETSNASLQSPSTETTLVNVADDSDGDEMTEKRLRTATDED